MWGTKLLNFHRMLVNDPVRMTAYRDAIHATVKPGDVVLDVGSGSGVLALFACQAGARRVHCVERDPIIHLARALSKANGFAECMVVHKCSVSELILPEPVDVIQSELIGKSGLGQRMAEVVGHCRDRFLRPGGSLLPRTVSLYVAPADASAARAVQSLPDAESYGIDFTAFSEAVATVPLSARIDPLELVVEGKVAYRYEAATAPLNDAFDCRLEFAVEQSRQFGGFVCWFDAELAPGSHLGNHPPGCASWDNHLFTVPEPVIVEPGDTIQLRLAARDDHRMQSLWRWETKVVRNSKVLADYRQSTLQAGLLVPQRGAHGA
jgi:precorrin-6B methylase 2